MPQPSRVKLCSAACSGSCAGGSSALPHLLLRQLWVATALMGRGIPLPMWPWASPRAWPACWATDTFRSGLQNCADLCAIKSGYYDFSGLGRSFQIAHGATASCSNSPHGGVISVLSEPLAVVGFCVQSSPFPASPSFQGLSPLPPTPLPSASSEIPFIDRRWIRKWFIMSCFNEFKDPF